MPALLVCLDASLTAYVTAYRCASFPACYSGYAVSLVTVYNTKCMYASLTAINTGYMEG